MSYLNKGKMKVGIILPLMIIIAMGLSACGSSSSSGGGKKSQDTATETETDTVTETDTGTGTSTETETETDTETETETETSTATATSTDIDITDAIFDERSADCAAYDNSYIASVLDEKRSLAFDMDVVITAGNTSCTLVSNSIPNHNFNDATASFATDVSENSKNFTITRTPALAASTTALSGGIYDAVMLNGVVVDIQSAGCYSPNSQGADADGNVAIGCNGAIDWSLDPVSPLTSFGEDAHNAHTQPDGTYHYHGNPNAMFDSNPGPDGSPVVGFAADGFPIYGSYFNDGGTVRLAVSSYKLIAGSRGTKTDENPGGNYDGMYTQDYEYIEDLGDLDACNGMTVDGQYGYYVVDYYPWMIKCLSGTVDSSFSK